MALLFTSTPARLPVWQSLFAAEGLPLIPGEEAVTDPAQVTAIACWVPPADLSRYPNLRAVISVGAGVDHLPPLPDGVALSRTLAPGIEAILFHFGDFRFRRRGRRSSRPSVRGRSRTAVREGGKS